MNTRTDPDRITALPLSPLVLFPGDRKRLLGQILVELGELSAGDLIKALALGAREDAKFGDILIAHGMVSESGLYRGLAVQFGCQVADFEATPADARLIDRIGPDFCLREGIVPWKPVGGAIVIASSRPEDFGRLRAALPESLGRVLLAVAPERDIQSALLSVRRRRLATRAETRVAASESCRDWSKTSMGLLVFAALLALVIGVIVSAQTTLLLLSLWAVAALVMNTALKTASAIASLRSGDEETPRFVSWRHRGKARRLPMVSIMVPLFREREIVARLVLRLSRLTYPKELIDICLVVEEDDTITQAALSSANLPRWMRQIIVPRGLLKTKPRALNYALDFCRGSIIGVYDAEDAPEPDQIHRIVRRFHDSGDDLACIQGILDFYNPKANWLSRCFTIEYATWFRVVLPGLARLGFVVPLGGTTLFLRRSVLEELGGWDAHNVTEDADLGVRLARHGYRTELINSVTAEEANCRLWPWIKQRSRWIKGYAITWAVHMRSPRKLLADLGLRRFVGVQLLFLGTLSQFVLAPVLWTFWAIPLGLHHPLSASLGPFGLGLLTGLFLIAEAITLGIGILGIAATRHRGLWPWVLAMHVYFPLAAVAGYKGIWEMIVKPFYWDKTAHGQAMAGTGLAPQARKPAPGSVRSHFEARFESL